MGTHFSKGSKTSSNLRSLTWLTKQMTHTLRKQITKQDLVDYKAETDDKANPDWTM